MLQTYVTPSLKGIKMDAGIWGFIGVAVGAASSIVTTVMAAKHSRLLQQETSSLESTERTREFQRDNLIQLQDRLSKYTALTIKYRTGSRREKLVTEASLEEFILSSQNLSILVERIADESLRKTVMGVIFAVNAAIDGTATDSADVAMELIVKASNKAWEEIGVVLRSNY